MFKSRDNAAPSPSTIVVRTYSPCLKERVAHSHLQGDDEIGCRGLQSLSINKLTTTSGAYSALAPSRWLRAPVSFLARPEAYFCSPAYFKAQFSGKNPLVRFFELIFTLPATAERRLFPTDNYSVESLFQACDDRQIW